MKLNSDENLDKAATRTFKPIRGENENVILYGYK
jgi:hypothetical protein